MDPTPPQEGPSPQDGGASGRPPGEAELQARAKLDRRAEALRANLKRRKAQVRGRADAGRDAAPD